MSRFSVKQKPSLSTTARSADTGRRSRNSGLTRVVGHGLSRFPGGVPGLRLHEALDSYGRPFAFVSTSGRGLHTVGVECGGDAGLLSSGRRLTTWVDQWLGGFADFGGASLVGISVVAEQQRRGVLNVALTFADVDTPRSGGGKSRKRDVRDMGVHIGSLLPRICSALEAKAETTAVPLAAIPLTHRVRAAFDPSVSTLLKAGGQPPALPWRGAPPKTVRERWDHVVFDGVTTIAWAMSGTPEEESAAHLLEPVPGVANVRLQLLLRRPQFPGFTDRPAVILAASAVAEPEAALPALDRTVERLSRLTRWRLRRVYGGQAAAFASNLNIGLAVPLQVKPPQLSGMKV